MVTIRNWLTLRRVLNAIVAGAAAVLVWWLLAYPRGMMVAWFDQARGRDAIKSYGLPPPWYRDYFELVTQRYGVSIDRVADCEISFDTEWYAAGYNSVSGPRIRRRFGKDIFVECNFNARAAWQQKQGK